MARGTSRREFKAACYTLKTKVAYSRFGLSDSEPAKPLEELLVRLLQDALLHTSFSHTQQMILVPPTL